MPNRKIFVSVANYRDSETPKTVVDMYAKAKYPERVFAGVHSQVEKINDLHCLAPSLPNVRQVFTHYKQSLGCCWARARIINELLQDEDFFLQIDSHTRFAQDWDVMAIKEWEACEDPKAFISHYPPGYTQDGYLNPPGYQHHKVLHFMFNGIPVMGSEVEHIAAAPAKPVRSPFFAGGCFFGRSELVRTVPYDPYIYFEGEEISMAYRLFSHGYNGYSIRQPFVWHLYYTEESGRPRHFEQHLDYPELNKTSFARVRHMLGIQHCTDPLYMKDYAKYQPGRLRSLQQYEHFSGVYFKEQRLAKRAILGDYK